MKQQVGSAIAGVALAGAFLAVAQPAQAYVPGLPPCVGSTCVGKTPLLKDRDGVTCADSAQLMETVTDPNGMDTVALWYSPLCQSNWTEFRSGQRAYSIYWSQSWDGAAQYGSGGWYSYMVDGTQLARACVQAEAATAWTAFKCTGWH